MKNKKTALLIATLVAIGVGLVAPAASQTSLDNSGTNQPTDNSTVDVEVASKIAVDISPSELAYQDVDPGAVSNNTTAGDEFYGHIEIENIGSANITQVWFNASMPTSNPFGTGVADNYNTGNFIQLRPNGDEGMIQDYDNYTFVNRREFSTDNVPEYIFRPDNTWEIGRFRVADQEYFWAVNTSSASGGTCEGPVRVGNQAHTLSETGSNDFSDSSSEYTEYGLTDAGTNEAVIDEAVNISQRNYRVKVSCGTEAAGSSDADLVRTKLNVEVGKGTLSSDIGNGANFTFHQGGTSTEPFLPGEHFSLDTRVSIPQGVAQGPVNDGFLRVLVNTQ